ncbi:hypothetical protein AX17_006429 [Amanita inopinata Kibby_2008]|nr:hypothetical protein AX17_006429 [Amanita inopinata Kibby_2008]
MAQPPFMSLPTQPSTTTSYLNFRNAPFTAAAAVSNTTASASTPGQPTYKAPAHKHAHHLHSIPPREKSTRTLIIDHMVWVHGRTRFAQARAELGMTDRTGGPSSSNYTHRRRPENYEEEDEVGSEGEDVSVLKARSGAAGQQQDNDEDERLSRQDLPLARGLRLRAEGLEKVVTSMLDQPPPIHPIDDDDLLTPPTSPKTDSSSQRNPPHPHTLPNGVRLRLALGTIINDLFARQAPHPPYRHTHPSGAKTPSSNPAYTPHETSTPDLPPTLALLSSVSGASTLFSHRTAQAPPTQHVYLSRLPFKLDSRTMSLYVAGADPQTAYSPPSFRCPRHLQIGCEICVEAKSGGSNGRPPASIGTVGGNTSVDMGASMRGMSDSAGSRGRRVPGGSGGWRGTSGGTTSTAVVRIGGWHDETGIGSGLLKPGVEGSALRRKVRDLDPLADDGNGGGISTGAGNTKLSKLIPRFLKLSALVAVELGSEAKEEEEEEENETKLKEGDEGDGGGGGGGGGATICASQQQTSGSALDTAAGSRLYEIALRPTREWYMLLAGLLTRAVLEGYLTAGWRGSQAVECLLTVGLGVQDASSTKVGMEEEEEELFEEFDPDDLPSLTDAVKLLFPGLRNSTSMRKGLAEEEYELEMYERLRRFYDAPSLTPDLAMHMEDLAWQYPAEPVERAAVRFCEAIAKWRGKPELETKPSLPTAGPAMMTIESLVHSNPTSPTMQNPMPPPPPQSPIPTISLAYPSRMLRRVKRKPSIDVYFAQPSSQESVWGRAGMKRPRSPGDAQAHGSPPKRVQM